MRPKHPSRPHSDNDPDLDEVESKSSGGGLIIAFCIGTVAWILLAVLFPPFIYERPAPFFGDASLGETGDYLTGWLTPLALAWFVLTVFLQRRELIHQRRELRLQRLEYRAANRERTAQTQVAKEQAAGMQESIDALREQLDLLRREHTGDTLSRIFTTGKELQIRAFDDPHLAPLISGEPELSPDKRRRLYMGILVNYYAHIFDLNNISPIPDTIWKAYTDDMANFFSTPTVEERWRELKRYHTDEFREFINGIISERATGNSGS